MSRIRARANASTEGSLFGLPRDHGLTGWRRHVRIKVSGSQLVTRGVRPDFVFPKSKLAVLVDGCFRHACPRHATKPKQNATFWREKIAAERLECLPDLGVSFEGEPGGGGAEGEEDAVWGR